jgi:hypothetical protein
MPFLQLSMRPIKLPNHLNLQEFFAAANQFNQLCIRQVTANTTSDKAALAVNDILLNKAEFSRPVGNTANDQAQRFDRAAAMK